MIAASGRSRGEAGVRILALAPVRAYGGFNTSRHRVEAFKAIGCVVDVVDTTPAPGAGVSRLAGKIRSQLFKMGFAVYARSDPRVMRDVEAVGATKSYDVIWLDKALRLDDADLRRLRSLFPGALLVGFSPDDMNARHNQSMQFVRALPHYDLFVTTKSYNVAELRQMGAPDVLFVGNGFDRSAFKPSEVSAQDRLRLGGEVGFIGSYESERARSILFLAENGIDVRVWGDGWESCPFSHPRMHIEYRPLFGEDFSRACCSFKINLGFLRKINRDRQTTRSVEIPACGAFMLAERTDEHMALFEEGVEAEFFSSDTELLEKCRRYLADDNARAAVAEAGLQRCNQSDYTNEGRMRAILDYMAGANEAFPKLPGPRP